MAETCQEMVHPIVRRKEDTAQRVSVLPRSPENLGGARPLTRPCLTVIMSHAPSSPRWPPSPVVSSYLTVEQEDARAVTAVMIPSIYSESEFSSESNKIVGSEVASIVTLA